MECDLRPTDRRAQCISLSSPHRALAASLSQLADKAGPLVSAFFSPFLSSSPCRLPLLCSARPPAPCLACPWAVPPLQVHQSATARPNLSRSFPHTSTDRTQSCCRDPVSPLPGLPPRISRARTPRSPVPSFKRPRAPLRPHLHPAATTQTLAAAALPCSAAQSSLRRHGDADPVPISP